MAKRISLEKLLQSLGLGTRKECRKLVRRGLVEIDGKVVEDPFMVVPKDLQKLMVAGESVEVHTELYIALHKPPRYECSHYPQQNESVFALFPPRFIKMALNSAGRLDLDTTGLILFSTNGQFIHHIESPRRGLTKTYEVELSEEVKTSQLEDLRAGMMLKGEKQALVPQSVKQLNSHKIELQISEGRYHQVKRMCKIAGLEVVRLHRTGIGKLELQNLPEGQWRYLDESDFKDLNWCV